MKIFVLIFMAYFYIGFFFNPLNAQDTQKLDSLIERLEHHAQDHDSIKYQIIKSILSNSTNPDDKAHYGNIGLALGQKHGNDIWKRFSYFHLGIAYQRKGELDKSLSYFFKSLKLYEEGGGPESIASLYLSIADVYSANENNSAAMSYYGKSITAFRNIKDSLKLAGALLNAGDEYFNAGQLDSALLFNQEAGLIYKLINSKVGLGYSLGNIGLVYAEQGQHETAELNINEATEILTALGHFYPVAVYLTYMADIYKAKGDLPRAFEYANQSLQLGLKEGFKEQIRDANKKLAELYTAQGDYQQAFHHQNQYFAYRDSIVNKKSIQNMANLEVARKQAEVDLKNKEVALLNQKRKTQTIIAIGLSIVLALLGVLAIILYRNSQKRLRTNKLLATQKSELERLNSTKDRFFSIISHDLRGPVNAFHGISRLIEGFAKDGDVASLEALADDIDESVDQLSSLLDNLLDWAVQQQGHFPNVPEKVRLKSLASDVVGTFATMAKSKDIRLSYEVQPDIYLWADRNSTMTIIRNLVNNALKFTKDGGEVTVSAAIEDSRAVIMVSDTGVGIPQGKLKKLFTLQAKKSTWGTGGEKGLGLGLSLVYEFVSMNGGDISVKSEEGVGTTFFITLSLYDTDHQLKHDENAV